VQREIDRLAWVGLFIGVERRDIQHEMIGRKNKDGKENRVG
jgi:hypothetical protein